MPTVVLAQAFNGLSVGSILLLAALGLAITFGLMNVINMAHGQFIMVGAYVAYTCTNAAGKLLGPSHAADGLLPSLPAAFVVAGLLGWGLERGLVRFLYKRPLDTLLATWGVGLVMQQAAKDIFGAPNVNVTAPGWMGNALLLGGVPLPFSRLFILGVSIVAVVGVYWYLFRTSNGRRIRAVMQNRAIADCMGVRIDQVDAWAFAVGTGLAGLAGAALCLIGPIGPFIGTDYIVQAFMVVVLGGAGQLLGTVAAAAAIGSLSSIVDYAFSVSVGQALVFAGIIAFLQWRPAGFVRARGR